MAELDVIERCRRNHEEPWGHILKDFKTGTTAAFVKIKFHFKDVSHSPLGRFYKYQITKM